jgi:hypothetical protein
MDGASGVATGLFCPPDRRCDAHSMVVHIGGPTPSAQADISRDPMERAQPSLTCKLNIRAIDALDRARDMPPGAERAGAMQEAMILENAAEMLRHFGGTRAGKIAG